MNHTTLSRIRIDDLTLNAFAHENLMLRDRIADLEAELRCACDLNVAAVNALRTALERPQWQRSLIRSLMGLPDLYDHADEKNVRGDYGEDDDLAETRSGQGRAA